MGEGRKLVEITVETKVETTINFEEILELLRKQKEINSFNKEIGHLETNKSLCRILGFGMLPFSVIFLIYRTEVSILLFPWLLSAFFIIYAGHIFSEKLTELETRADEIKDDIKPIEEKLEELKSIKEESSIDVDV